MKGLHLISSELYISYERLRSYCISKKNIDKWSCRGKSVKRIIEDKVHLLFDSIPNPTYYKNLPSKSDLISECHLLEHESKVDEHYQEIYYAFHKGYIQHIEPFKEQHPTLQRKKIVVAAKRFAVWKYINESGSFNTLALYNAYNKIYKGECKSYNVFANKKSRAKIEGIEAMAIDQRWFTTPKNVKKINVVNQYWAAALISIGKKYSNRKVFQMLCSLCEQSNEIPPSKGWVDKYRKSILKGNANVFESRNGKSALADKQLTFATMQQALYANDQWQYDGWNLPFYIDGFKRYSIVVVRDAHSKKIIGSAVGQTENTIVIMAALKDAIINTGCVPYEIVTDNHSWHRTGEAEHFVANLQSIGTQYTVTSSPTRKVVTERYNRHLDSLCKDYSGYLGEGIKSKSIDAHPNPDNALKFKELITADEVMLIGIKIVEDFNNEVLPKYKKTPNELYEESQKPNCFLVNVFDRVKLLTPKSTFKISRGQLTIKRGFDVHEYQLPAELNKRLNNTTVAVRYEELKEGIYVYDEQTDEFIIELKPKPVIHAAKANQTERDIELLNKNKGRITGIKTKSKKYNEELVKMALEANPEAYISLNKLTTSKDIIKEFEQKSALKKLAESKGIDIMKIVIPQRKNELDNDSFKPPKPVINESPFQPKEEGELRTINRNYFRDKDFN